MFEYPDEIRTVIYTTNAIESLNSVIRKWIKNRRIFPNDTSAIKIVYLAIQCQHRSKLAEFLQFNTVGDNSAGF